jgi:hypothetical protein
MRVWIFCILDAYQLAMPCNLLALKLFLLFAIVDTLKNIIAIIRMFCYWHMFKIFIHDIYTLVSFKLFAHNLKLSPGMNIL